MDRPLRLPPLNALRVFQTVVRHRSFRGAADELSVTPQAVSQQIKLLEDTLGLELFARKGRAIEPNEQAILLAHHIQAGFDEFAEGVRRVTKLGQRNRINVNASPYFATRFLLDRLARFREIMPGADLRLTTMVELPDFVADDVDVAIQWGFGTWTNHEQTLLLRDIKVICCTPPASPPACTRRGICWTCRYSIPCWPTSGCRFCGTLASRETMPPTRCGFRMLPPCGGRPWRGWGWVCCQPLMPRKTSPRANWWPRLGWM